MIYLNKILPLFVLPFGITLILIVAGLVRRRWSLVWTGLAVIWISGTPLVADVLLGALEGGAERQPAATAPAADAIVVLSAGRVTAPGPARISEWGDPDRFFGGVELFEAGKAPLLVFTGGWVPWAPDDVPEGQILRQHAVRLGVPADRILVTGSVVNTAAEATAVAQLLRERQMAHARVLLVTSAFHMARARALFESAGLVVSPFPVDFVAGAGERRTVLDILPNAGSLGRSSVAIRELYGRLYYWARAIW